MKAQPLCYIRRQTGLVFFRI